MMKLLKSIKIVDNEHTRTQLARETTKLLKQYWF